MVPDLDLCLAAQELKILPTAIPCESSGSALCRSVYTPATLKRAWNTANHTQLFVQPNWEACGIRPAHVWLSLVIIHTPWMDFPEQKPVYSAFLCGSWSSREIQASSREGATERSRCRPDVSYITTKQYVRKVICCAVFHPAVSSLTRHVKKELYQRTDVPPSIIQESPHHFAVRPGFLSIGC